MSAMDPQKIAPIRNPAKTTCAGMPVILNNKVYNTRLYHGVWIWLTGMLKEVGLCALAIKHCSHETDISLL